MPDSVKPVDKSKMPSRHVSVGPKRPSQIILLCDGDDRRRDCSRLSVSSHME